MNLLEDEKRIFETLEQNCLLLYSTGVHGTMSGNSDSSVTTPSKERGPNAREGLPEARQV